MHPINLIAAMQRACHVAFVHFVRCVEEFVLSLSDSVGNAVKEIKNICWYPYFLMKRLFIRFYIPVSRLYFRMVNFCSHIRLPLNRMRNIVGSNELIRKCYNKRFDK